MDEGNESYDVSVTVSGSKEVTSHSCDCPSVNDICRHKVALMLHLVKGKAPEKVVKAKKNKNPADSHSNVTIEDKQLGVSWQHRKM